MSGISCPNKKPADMNIIIVDHDRIDEDTAWSKKLHEVIRKHYKYTDIYENEGSFAVSQNLTQLQDDIINKKPDIVIAHLGESGLIFQEGCDWVGCIIYVTSAPGGRREEDRKTGSRYDLFMRRGKQDSLYCDWKSLLHLCVESCQCNNLLLGSSVLNAELGPMRTTYIMQALSILCQGYLAVHCRPDPQGEDGIKVETNDSTGEIRLALMDMRWGEVLKQGKMDDWLDPRLTLPNQQGRQELRIEVSKTSYWDVFNEMDTQEFYDAVAREWRTVSSERFEDSKTSELVGALPNISTYEKFSLIVAQAFRELNHLLGRATNV